MLVFQNIIFFLFGEVLWVMTYFIIIEICDLSLFSTINAGGRGEVKIYQLYSYSCFLLRYQYFFSFFSTFLLEISQFLAGNELYYFEAC